MPPNAFFFCNNQNIMDANVGVSCEANLADRNTSEPRAFAELQLGQHWEGLSLGYNTNVW